MRWYPGVVLFTFLCGLVISSCQRVKPNTPEATQLDSVLSVPVSTLTFPISYEVDKLAEMVNSKLQGTFLEERFGMNEKGDSLFINIEKLDLIKLSWNGKKLSYTFPVKVSGKFIKKIAGIRVRNQEAVETELEIDLATSFSLDNRWNLITESKLESIRWIKEPTLKIAILKINLKKSVEQAIRHYEDTLIVKLDQTIQGLIDTRQVMTKLWVDIQKPIRINKIGREVWLNAFATDLRGMILDSDTRNITFKVQLSAQLQTLLEGDPVPAANKVLPPFKELRKTARMDSLDVFVRATIPFSMVNEILRDELIGKKLENRGYSTTIRNIRIFGIQHGLAMRLDVKGDVNGYFYATAFPAYDTALSVLHMGRFSYDVDTENVLVHSAQWLLNDHILDFVAENTKIDVQPYIDQLPELIMSGVEKGGVGEKVDLTIGALAVRPVQYIVTKDNFQIILEGKGTAALDLEQKVFVKRRRRP